MKSTIYDVARLANVSIATVSKVMNDNGKISDKTRKKVFEVMQHLHFKPSMVATALTGKKTYTLGLLISDLANPFFAEIARSVEDRAHELGFSVVMCSTDNDSQKEAKSISLLRQKSVDGFIIASGFQNHLILRKVIEEHVPIALISQDISSLAVDCVTVDDFLGGYQVTRHLLDLGHQNVAVFAEKTRSSKERIRGFKQAVEEAGIRFQDRMVIFCDTSVDGGKQKADQLMDWPNRPTAIFACNDLLAVGVMESAREWGLKIPDDLSVVGFDNTILATSVDPPLTSVAQPIQEMGRQVVELLIARIEGRKKMKRRVILLPELVFRRSTKSLLSTPR